MDSFTSNTCLSLRLTLTLTLAQSLTVNLALTVNPSHAWTGVVAVAVYGLYGSATSKFDISPKLEESGAFESFW